MFVEDSMDPKAGSLQEIRFRRGSIVLLTGKNAALVPINARGNRTRFVHRALGFLQEFEEVNDEALANYGSVAGPLQGVHAMLIRIAARARPRTRGSDPRGCPSAVTARVTAKRCSLDALTLAEGLLDAALSPCHGAPRTRGCRGGTHTVSSPGLHRASLVSATLRWSGKTKGRRRDKDSLAPPHVYLGPSGSVALSVGSRWTSFAMRSPSCSSEKAGTN